MRDANEVLESLDLSKTALFLDFDGTLADFVQDPAAVVVAPATLDVLMRLHRRLDGALAIITGRDVATIDRFLAPHVLPVSGVHGFETRTDAGQIERLPVDEAALAEVAESLAPLAGSNDGLLLERKAASVALHYRRRPELEDACKAAVADAVDGVPSLRVLRGHMVIEVKAHVGDKGQAIDRFMSEPPFQGRVPVFAGDDVTDEAAFRQVNRLDGLSFKIGGGPTEALFRLEGPAAMRAWLAALAARFDDHETTGATAT